MGSAVSIPQVSAKDIGDFVGQLSGGVAKYKDAFIENDIDGYMLSTLDDEGLQETLEEIGVKSKLHQRKLQSELKKVIDMGSSDMNLSSSTSSISSPTKVGYDDVDFREEVSIAPSVLMSRLFAIQGIACDPTDLDPCLSILVTTMQNRLEKLQAAGIEPKEFDCFINYRVSAEKDIAEKLYYALQSAGLIPFWDKKKLIAGEGWKEGFLRGLKNSSCFVALISSDALAPVRDVYCDHTYDNVLLEYQMALDLNDRHRKAEKPEIVIPVHIGKMEGGALYKFRDFSSSLYSDSIKAKENPEEVKRKRLLAEKAEKERLEQEAIEKEDADIEIFIQSKDVANLVQLLKYGKSIETKKKVIWFMQAYANNDKSDSNDKQRAELTENGAIPGLIDSLYINELAEHAALALMRTGRNTDNQIKIAAEGGIPPLITLLKNGTDEGKTKAAGALRNLTFHEIGKNTIRSTGLETIRTALNNENDANVKSAIQNLLDRF